eukprot:12401232-Karenia_brevis.AAC.1
MVTNERLIGLDAVICGRMVRFIAAYFPHSGYHDSCVQEVYSILSSLKKEADAKGYVTCIGGDFNAE